MRKLLVIILCVLTLSSSAQNFYFPKNYYADSLALTRRMPVLAGQVLAVYKDADKGNYYDNIFRYQLVAGQYPDAIAILDSLRILYKADDSVTVKGMGFQFQVFATTKIKQAQQQHIFNDVYASTFIQLFNALPEKAAAVASSYFDNDVPSLKAKLLSLLDARNGKDSIGYMDARALCRAYNSYIVYSQIVPLSKPLLAGIDNKKFIIEDSALLSTRDGAQLAATIIRKKDATGKLPVVFVFNIYNSPRDKSIAKEAALKGYVGIVVNTRGKRLSPQQIEPFEHDAHDAYDIIDWISKQSWCNGKVGMFGGSYLGFSQWAAAKKVHPALKTIVPQVAVGIGIDYPMQNNVFMSYMLQWIHYVTNSKETDQADFNNQAHWYSVFTKYYVRGQSFRSLDTIEKRPSAIFQRWLRHPDHDAYWQNMVAYKNDFAKINIPVLTTTGYYDDDQLGAMYYFNQHHLFNKNARHYLVIGPYNHGGAQSQAAAVLNGYTIDSVANISINSLVYQWFDYILKDSAKPALLKDKINYQVMGANEWKHAPTLAAMNNDTIRFYLGNTRVGSHYRLDTKPAAIPEFIRQEVDFKDRSDSARKLAENIIDSTVDMSNGLSFISEPFSKSVDINGAYIAELKASINKKDMDVFISMYELLPGGKYFSLGSFLGRASYSRDRSKRQLLQPGKTASIPVNSTFFTSRRIAAGNRLLLVVGINKNPWWQINYGTGKDVSDETIKDAAVPLQVKWFTDSVIKLPVHR